MTEEHKRSETGPEVQAPCWHSQQSYDEGSGWGWKEWQLMLLPLLIYDLSNHVKIPKGHGQWFEAGSCLYSLGCQARTCTFSSPLRVVRLSFPASSLQARVFPLKAAHTSTSLLSIFPHGTGLPSIPFPSLPPSLLFPAPPLHSSPFLSLPFPPLPLLNLLVCLSVYLSSLFPQR